ncbi:GAF and ANTAR domain-containing protein [Saccharopolyspora mangrovi]|uniref:GAF and ANTAR domain-containing protein n=1 Tax=Saccharopolyspora mangrovi TaxID=3082379 RepID=A0ABU6AFB2_9PSEU|nr:GAF and ANTAR domain-containing protein [Saccharopolyspora sp. S2-29]MEB3370126.1 GAF and ANTAR domain-containing protein [Saccharopolyspora sp. S2-29]
MADAFAAIVAAGEHDAPLQVCQVAVDALPFDGASITTMTDSHRQEPVCATNEAARRITELQFELGEGPDLDAHESGRPVHVLDLAELGEHHWPLFGHAVGGELARTLHALPLNTDGASLGTLCFHSATLEHLAVQDVANARRTADIATWAVLGVIAQEAPQQEIDRLQGRLQCWVKLHQAIGVISAQMQVEIETALTCLRAHAFVCDRRLSDVAHDVVIGTLRFDDGR